MEVSANKENKSMPRDPQDNKVVQCASNLQDKSFHEEEASHGDGAKAAAVGSEDVEVNIIDCTTASYNKQIEARCDDAVTESISSFGDTESETKNGTSGLSDTEIESQLFVGGGQMSIFEGYGGSFQMRRKKLTDHWRRFIRPLMWRCKWVELKITELQSHAFKYDREIAEDEQRKMLDLETFIGGFPVKSLPFSTCVTRKKAMTRKKRKRFEETEDVASYMLQHNLFSYYVNKKSTTDGASIDDGCSNPAKTINDNDEFGTQDGLTSLQSRDSISEHILRQIEVLKSQVHKLKSRADKVACENPVNFFPVNDLSILAPCSALTSSEQNPASVPKIGDRLLHIQTQRMSGCNMGDLMPESAISCHGEATFRSDIIGNTCQPNGGVSSGNAEEGILIRNAAVKEEIGNLIHFDSGLTEKPLGVSEKQTVQASDPDLPEELLVARVLFGGKSLPKSRSNVSNYKRKRGRKN
ncbi:hypothetical protein OIU77_019423 [Salix suchowensis]|uniref:Uncharacterized protein n=1 Tax=Salix suchowensis TaxID=1278906 RepID=A0ABQ9CG87_9ROSI|nr:hypothetical protein OIU77_019423 [Salix suchowensis]KAJ6398633.1 hypothetical protein OIU77_019423 [Salix suchowensis]